MTVAELIEKLQEFPPECEAKIAFDSGIRMDVEVVASTYDVGEQVAVITDLDEWRDREGW